MKISVVIDASELRELVLAHLRAKLGDVKLEARDVRIEVKSNQNYRAEWESAAFRAVVEKVGA